MILGDFQHGKERGLIFQHDDGSYSFAVDVTCRHVGVDPLDENSTLLHIQWPTLDGI